jgi:hypothetical protein
MMTMDASTIVLAAAALVAVSAAGYLWWRRTHQKTPAERERLRRMAVNAAGRLTDGVLVESPYIQSSAPEPRLLFFRYHVAGVEYTAAQDVSALASEGDAATWRTGTVASVKYDPRKPSNSIVICEQWSGLPERGDSLPQNRMAANG